MKKYLNFYKKSSISSSYALDGKNLLEEQQWNPPHMVAQQLLLIEEGLGETFNNKLILNKFRFILDLEKSNSKNYQK